MRRSARSIAIPEAVRPQTPSCSHFSGSADHDRSVLLTLKSVRGSLIKMKFSEFNLQPWGYAAGLLAAPFFFLFSYFFGDASGIFAAIIIGGCLLIARVNFEILSFFFGASTLIACSIFGLAISAFVGAQRLPLVIAEGAIFVICVWGVSIAVVKRMRRDTR